MLSIAGGFDAALTEAGVLACTVHDMASLFTVTVAAQMMAIL